jgi:hypothetical protein
VLVSRSVRVPLDGGGRRSPWFPGFPVYRQGEKGDWAQAMDAIVADVSPESVYNLLIWNDINRIGGLLQKRHRSTPKPLFRR